MRIATTSINDFITNLENCRGVYRKCVYFERSSKPLNGKTKADATSFAEFYQATAVLEFEDDGQALLVCGIDCGIDRLTGDGGFEGSAKRGGIHKVLKEACDRNGLVLMPGVLDQ